MMVGSRPNAVSLTATVVAMIVGMVVSMVVGCASHDPIEIVVGDERIQRTFAVDGSRDVVIARRSDALVEAWVGGAAFGEISDAQRAAGLPETWLAPQGLDGFTIVGDGEVELIVWPRGPLAPAATRDRSLAWFDGRLLDDRTIISFARVMAAIADDAHGGRLLQRWFAAFAAGPGAGRAAFAQFLDEIETSQGSDASAWNLDALPFRVTGVHNRHDLMRGDHCGELRVSVASTHPAFAPLHFIFLFRQRPADDDIAPDGSVHCRGTSLRWARLASTDDASWPSRVRELIATTLVREQFLVAESVELTISPWQWRQWISDGNGGLVNPPLFQTVDVARVNAPGATRDDFLAEVAANADALAAREWEIPARFRSAVVEASPNVKAPLVDLSTLSVPAELPRTIGMMGCPRCHTDDADFIQTSVDRVPSPFYDRELDARASWLDARARGEWPARPAFGPLQAF